MSLATFIPVLPDGYYSHDPMLRTVYAPRFAQNGLFGQRKNLWSRPHITVNMDYGNFNPHTTTKAIRPCVSYQRPIKWEGQVWDPYTATGGTGPTKPRALLRHELPQYYQRPPGQLCYHPGLCSGKMDNTCCTVQSFCRAAKPAGSWRSDPPTDDFCCQSKCNGPIKTSGLKIESCRTDAYAVNKGSCLSKDNSPAGTGCKPGSRDFCGSNPPTVNNCCQSNMAGPIAARDPLVCCPGRRGCYRPTQTQYGLPARTAPGNTWELSRNADLQYHDNVKALRADVATHKQILADHTTLYPPKRKAHEF